MPKQKQKLSNGTPATGKGVVKSAAVQLRECLRLENNPDLFDRIRSNLRELAVEHLDVNCPASQQENALETIQSKLQVQYPDIFDSENKERRLYLAVRVIYQQHTWQIQKHRNSIGRKSSQKQPENEGRFEEVVAKDLGEEINPESLSQTLVASSSQSSSQSSKTSGSSTMVTQLGADKLTCSPQSSQLPSLSIPPCSSSPGDPNVRQLGTGIRAVLNFLECCTPSMGHLLHHFITFGCSSEEYLLGVSGWQPEVINNFLKQVLTDRQTGEPLVPPMDIFVLQTHFSTYYRA